ncbi:nuclear transport factor 2 family protein [Actinomadura sp. NEAU-AAG7]|uniref:nuclear transport factor 2 family protein n=1 Tax=Actinomadura sp. NEAU-AAG7 TaxID=2839640 RepID=UPI001BE4AF02|nr:nuclear transport factor 2 family protein [Actinomadura sp. NEAU-AAG7]MBT2207781.1 nuclear transport factor 2 family protein [Actinomadura sp. NEAU-AAG7]
MRFSGQVGLAALVLALATGCSGTARPGRADPSGSPAAPPADRAAAERIAQRFVEAANAGDRKGVAAVFAENARFDSVGRIYRSREEIMTRFLIPEVLDAGGRYKVTRSRWDGERYRVDYDFSTGSGGGESFSYAFLVRDGLIRDVLGRYH